MKPGRQCLSGLFTGLVGLVLAAPSALAATGEPTAVELGPAQLTERAVEAGLEGELRRRRVLLDRAIRVQPDYAPARWEAGHISVDGQWRPLDEAQAQAAADPRLQEYQAARSAVGDSPQAHLGLARWCREQELADEARYHWLKVLEAAPQHEEALDALDSTWRDGRLVTRDEASRLDEEQRAQRRIDQQWKVRIAKWERQLAEGAPVSQAVLRELTREVDASAIPEFERLARDIKGATPTVANRRRALSLAFIEALSRMQDYAATESLARIAVFAPDDYLRAAAIGGLAAKPLADSVPPLLAGLASPIESHYSVSMDDSRNLHYLHELFTQTPEVDQVYERASNSHLKFAEARFSTRSGAPLPDTLALRRALGIAEETARRQMHWQFVSEVARVGSEIREVEQAVTNENARRDALNRRITGVLCQLTGAELGDTPIAWWTYWNQINELQIPSERVTRRLLQTSSRVSCLPPPSVDCFVAGTRVWTKSGAAPIESLTTGDLVLSKDLATGELRYRAVLATTERPPSPTVTVDVGGESIQSTVGHPYWSPTGGWQMAKELSPGDLLLGVEGPIRIESIAEGGEAVAYDLRVEGLATYFVGETGVLVHDNTPRRSGIVNVVAR